VAPFLRVSPPKFSMNSPISPSPPLPSPSHAAHDETLTRKFKSSDVRGNKVISSRNLFMNLLKMFTGIKMLFS